jgi:lipopolysaccharide transport system ATP-binding protein
MASALRVSSVYKKFKKGEIHNSIRDLIPALTGKLFKAHKSGKLVNNEFWALSNVSFNVEKGDAFGIIGGNGAGKSTILKLLSRVLKPTMGQIVVAGKISALIEVGAGFHEDLTGRENVFLNGTILGMKRDEIRKKFDEIVDFSGLADFIDTPVKRYSSGMYARLGFSIAAHVNPNILIVDEVLSVGDAVFQKKCFEKMTSIIQSGATVIFVSHNLRAVSQLCKKSLLLEKGNVVKIGKTNEVIKDYKDRIRVGESDCSQNSAYVSNFKIRDTNGHDITLQSGSKSWIDVEITANKATKDIGIVLDLKDDHYYTVFDTSSVRLNQSPVFMEKGTKLNCTFELSMHLAPGTYHFGCTIYDYGKRKVLYANSHSKTIYINSCIDVAGTAHLYPKVTRFERQ